MLSLKNISYSYGDFNAVKNVSLEVNDGEIICLLGPSGCGKTTLLRIITGLEKGYTGKVLLDGKDVGDVPVNERDFGLMFQDFALFPHMSVAENIAYGLKRRGKQKQDIKKQVTSILEQVGLVGFEKRDVNMLSGGQKQRVALARSLAPNPRLLMLDEPLGSLDALLRDQLIVELRDTIRSVGLTAIYVTHDQKEAFSIADRIAVMNSGRIEQIDTPQQVYESPKTAFVARFLGLSNSFPKGDSSVIKRLMDISPHDFSNADEILVHPMGITISKSEMRTNNEFNGIIQSVVFRGDHSHVVIHIDDKLPLRVTTLESNYAVGQLVTLQIVPEYILPM